MFSYVTLECEKNVAIENEKFTFVAIENLKFTFVALENEKFKQLMHERRDTFNGTGTRNGFKN